MERWVRHNHNHSKLSSHNRLLSLDKNITFQFAIAVLLLGSILSLMTYYEAKRFDPSSHLSVLFSGIIAVILLDGMKHLGFSIILKKYTSGVMTAVLVEIPYAAYALYRFNDAGMIDAIVILKGIVVALPLSIFLVWAGLLLGRKLAPYRKQA